MLKTPSEQKENSLGRLQGKVQVQQRLGYYLGAWMMYTLKRGVRILWDSLQTHDDIHACLLLPLWAVFIDLVQIKTTEKVSILLGAHPYFKSGPLPNSFGALGSPNTRSGRAPNEDCYRSITDNEGNNGNAIEGTGRNGGQEQKTEGKACLLHHAEIRTSQKKIILSWLKQRNLSYIAIGLFFFLLPFKHFNIVKWLRGWAPLRHLWGICC